MFQELNELVESLIKEFNSNQGSFNVDELDYAVSRLTELKQFAPDENGRLFAERFTDAVGSIANVMHKMTGVQENVSKFMQWTKRLNRTLAECGDVLTGEMSVPFRFIPENAQELIQKEISQYTNSSFVDISHSENIVKFGKQTLGIFDAVAYELPYFNVYFNWNELNVQPALLNGNAIVRQPEEGSTKVLVWTLFNNKLELSWFDHNGWIYTSELKQQIEKAGI